MPFFAIKHRLLSVRLRGIFLSHVVVQEIMHRGPQSTLSAKYMSVFDISAGKHGLLRGQTEKQIEINTLDFIHVGRRAPEADAVGVLSSMWLVHRYFSIWSSRYSGADSRYFLLRMFV